MKKLTAARLERAVRTYLRRVGFAGGPFHLLIDGNFTRSAVEFCTSEAIANGDTCGARLGFICQRASMTQISKAFKHASRLP